MIKEVITRKQAKELGLARYFTGKPCPHGHVCERKTKSAACLICRKAHEAPAIKAKTKRYCKTDKGRMARRLIANRHYAKSSTKIRVDEQRVIKKFGALPEGYNNRPTKCCLCLCEGKQIVLDHCHIKNVFRGWICTMCNKALGCIYDNVDTLQRMIVYLRSDGADVSLPVESNHGGCYEPEVSGYG